MTSDSPPPADPPGLDDDAIRAVVRRLARPIPGGSGHVIERVAITAEGSNRSAIEAWIASVGGRPETRETSAPTGGLHGDRAPVRSAPVRFVLPPGALG